MPESELVPLPRHPEGLPWPMREWPRAEPGAEVARERLEKELEAVFAEPPPASHGATFALVVIHRGRLVAERYDAEHGPESVLPSWSTAKSLLHAVIGILVREGRLDPRAPAPVPAWQGPGDPRRAITVEHLLRMSSGLRFLEDYEDPERSDTIRMLFGPGKQDVAAYAEEQPLDHPPGSVWNYASGTSNILAAIAGRAVGGGRAGMESFLRRELFDRLGMQSADPRFDAAGTWIGSSFAFATARDFARFGYLYLRDGVSEGARVLPPGWVDHARTPTPASAGEYGAHWWLALDGSGRFSANGYRGQYVVVDPARDLVVVRLGASSPEQRVHVVHFLKAVVECFPEG
jgi:CubicO group peptidase (beta-lactamase class C family)